MTPEQPKYTPEQAATRNALAYYVSHRAVLDFLKGEEPDSRDLMAMHRHLGHYGATRPLLPYGADPARALRRRPLLPQTPLKVPPRGSQSAIGSLMRELHTARAAGGVQGAVASRRVHRFSTACGTRLAD